VGICCRVSGKGAKIDKERAKDGGRWPNLVGNTFSMQACPATTPRLSSLFHHHSRHSTTRFPVFARIIISKSKVQLEASHPSFGRIRLSSAAGDMQVIHGTPPRPILCAHGGRLHEAGWSSDTTQTLAAVSLVNLFFRSWEAAQLVTYPCPAR
jgi:hypothetical protein